VECASVCDRDKAKGRGMSASDVAAHLAECRAILGGESSKLGRIWNTRASLRDRRLMLVLSGQRARLGSGLADLPWHAVPPDVRSQVVDGMRRFKAWADEVCK